MSSPNQSKQNRTFKTDASVIYSIIREQAGDPVKAITEMVMNSVDAGAKKIEITLDAEKISIVDDGMGFPNSQYIEDYFSTFGTPRKKGEESTYGVFRIGRGQAFALFSTEWRSGFYGMHVDLGGLNKTDFHGYKLFTYDNEFKGCKVDGVFYKKLNEHESMSNTEVFNAYLANALDKFDADNFRFKDFINDDFFNRLVRLISLVNCQIYLNGKSISLSLPPSTIYSSDEADIYNTKGIGNHLMIFNKGVFVSHHYSNVPTIINFKKTTNINMARNAIDRDCPIYNRVLNKLSAVLLDAFLKEEPWAKGFKNSILYSLKNTMDSNGNLDRLAASCEESYILRALLQDKDKIPKILNLIEETIFNGDSFETIGLYDLYEKIETEEFYISNHIQNYNLKSLSKRLQRIYLSSLSLNKKIILDSCDVFEYSSYKYSESKVKQSYELVYLTICFLLNKKPKPLKLFTHDFFNDIKHFVSMNKQEKAKVKDSRDAKSSLSVRDKILAAMLETDYFRYGVTKLNKKTEKKFDESSIVLANLFSTVRSIFQSSANKNGFKFDETCALSMVKDIGVIFCGDLRSYSMSVFFDGKIYFLIDPYAINQGYYSIVTSLLFNPVQFEITDDLSFNFILHDDNIYESNDANAKILDCLESISNELEFFSFLEQEINNINKVFVNGYSRPNKSQVNLAKQVLSLVGKYPNLLADAGDVEVLNRMSKITL